MRPPLTFFVAGVPCGQPRIKASGRGGFVRCYTPTTVKSKAGVRKEHPATTWKNQVIAEAQKHKQALWEGPLCVNLTFYFPRPKSHFKSNGELKPNAPKWHTSKPDRDNLDKLCLDAQTIKQGLAKGDLWKDDCQVCDGRIRKFYASHNCAAGCYIEIKEAE